MLYKGLLYFAEAFPLLQVFKYISLRSILAAITSLMLSLCYGDRFIAYLRNKFTAGQPIREDGPATHFVKQGTPTMGGVLILTTVLISCILWVDISNLYIRTILFVMCSLALLGGIDDYHKVTKKNSRGISAKQKLFWQCTIGTLATYYVTLHHYYLHNTMLTFPFFKNIMLDLGWFYLIFGALVVTGTSNAVNLTDGLDGLVIVPIILVCACFAFISYLVGHTVLADYLLVVKIPGSSEIAVLMAAIIGASLGFLWFNCAPAQIFMGDVGSLSLGGAIGITAVAIKHEIVLCIIGGLFVIEALSVLIQVFSFKTRGKRVFLMAPIHHHFEKLGWPETKVVIRFWIIALLFALLGLSTLKLR